jgi:hypothetical protein
LLANSQFRPVPPASAYTAFPARLASDASADQDVVRPPSAARFPALSQEPVRDFRSARAAQAQLDAPLSHPVPQPQAAQRKVVFPVPQDAARLVSQAADHQAHSSADSPVPADEWVSVPTVGPQVLQRAQPASPRVEPR